MSNTYTSSERAYHDVKERILTGRLAGGVLISEGDIAADLGTSRTPVREAFLRLEVEGWMKLYPKRGALVMPIPADEAHHVLHARYVVETAAVSTLAHRDRTRLVARLRAELGPATDFHRAPVAAAGNPLLLSFYDSLREHQRRLPAAPVNWQLAAQQHLSLLDCLEHGDVEGFANELAHHFFALHQVRVRDR